MNKKLKLIEIIGVISLALIVSVLFVRADWTPPTTSPTTCPSGQPGCDAPINTSSSTQFKIGSLGINGSFSAVGAVQAGSFCLGNNCITSWPSSSSSNISKSTTAIYQCPIKSNCKIPGGNITYSSQCIGQLSSNNSCLSPHFNGSASCIYSSSPCSFLGYLVQ